MFIRNKSVILCKKIYFYVLYYNIGGTPLGMYKYLIKYYKAGNVSFKYVKTFNMDEYVGKYLTILSIYVYYIQWHRTPPSDIVKTIALIRVVPLRGVYLVIFSQFPGKFC